MGIWQILGHHVPREAEAGMQRLTLAARAGNDIACALLASSYAAGLAVPQSWNDSLDWLVEAARLGNVRAHSQLKLLLPSTDASSVESAVRGESPWSDVRKHIDLQPFLQAPSADVPLAGGPISIFRKLIPRSFCTYLMQLAAPALQRAEVHDDDEGLRVHEMRTNSIARFSVTDMDVVLRLIEQQIAAISGLPLQFQEDLNVLRYLPGEEYRPHFDFFDPRVARFREQLATRGQRVATVLVYLSDGFEGGDTAFEQLSFRFRGEPGDAIVFRNVDAAGEPDRRTLHAGLAPSSGEKWVISKWIRDRAQRDRGG
jgi:prolyl 4-hydroxylase